MNIQLLQSLLTDVKNGKVEVSQPLQLLLRLRPSMIASLFTMLNSCASGISVVNIDNGFGAGYLASIINQQSVHP